MVCKIVVDWLGAWIFDLNAAFYSYSIPTEYLSLYPAIFHRFMRICSIFRTILGAVGYKYVVLPSNSTTGNNIVTNRHVSLKPSYDIELLYFTTAFIFLASIIPGSSCVSFWGWNNTSFFSVCSCSRFVVKNLWEVCTSHEGVLLGKWKETCW